MTNCLNRCLLGFVWLTLLGSATVVTAQTSPVPVPLPNAMAGLPGPKLVDGQRPYRYVEKMPVYLNGGKDGLQAAITSHVHGGAATGSRAFVTFIVDRQGNIRDPAFGGKSEPETANVEPSLAKAFAAFGKFRPGTQNGQLVNVEITMPIRPQAAR